MTQDAPHQHATKRPCPLSTEAPRPKRRQTSDAGASGLQQRPRPQQLLQPVIQPMDTTLASPSSCPLLVPDLSHTQEPDSYHAVWEFVVLWRTVRGSELCLPCQNAILDEMSNEIRGSSVHLLSHLRYALPPGFNRHYLDFLVNPDPDQGSSMTTTPEIPSLFDTAPPQPSTTASSLPDVAEPNLERPYSLGRCPPQQSTTTSPLPDVAEPNLEHPSSLSLCQSSLQSEPETLTQTQSPAGCRIVTTARMFVHFPYFRSLISVIEAQAKIWITTRPEDFRQILHDQWMLALPEELAAKLWFACQGRFTLMDLATGRTFSDADGDERAYMAVMRRYLLAVVDAGVGFLPGHHPAAQRCYCPGKGWIHDAAIAGIGNSDSLSAEEILNQQVNCFVTGRTPSDLDFAAEKLPSPPKTAYLTPDIVSILEHGLSMRALRGIYRKDWMSFAFSYQLQRHGLADLSRTGRLILHHSLRELYNELAGAYQAAEPVRPTSDDAPLQNPYPASKTLKDYPDWDPLNRPRNRSGVKPAEHTFEACRMYLGFQMSVDSWRDSAHMMVLSPSLSLSPMITPSNLGLGTRLGLGIHLGTEVDRPAHVASGPGIVRTADQGNIKEKERNTEEKEERRARQRQGKMFTRTILMNQPWDSPSRWECSGKEYLLCPANEMRDALAFLAGGAMEWRRAASLR